MRAGGGRRDLGDVGVVGFPLCDVVEEGPDLGGGEALDYYFVGDEVVGGAGEVFFGPDYLRCHDWSFEVVGNKLLYLNRW